MLTKDLVKFTRRKDKIVPLSLSTEEPELLKLAQTLVELYSNGIDQRRDDLEEESSIIVNSFAQPLMARGLNKLCLDRSDFTPCLDIDFPEAREQLFDTAATLLKQSGELDYESYIDKVQEQMPPEHYEFIQGDIYADLPASDRLIKFKPTRAIDLLHRYNVAQVQYHLLFAKNVKFTLKKVEAAQLRRLFKYLKFFRLLARIEGSARGTLKLTIDGPVSLFENTKKYGMQLSNFFPAVIDCPVWSMEAEVDLPQRKNMQLKQSQKQGLIGHYKNFSAFVPEEIRLFHRSFREKVDDWEIVGEAPFMQIKDENGQELIFPDLSFQGPRKKDLIHLELFHRWHAGQLRRRLDQLASNSKHKLIIGVDRSLVRSKQAEEDICSHPYFAENGFLFRDFPSVNRVKALLEKLTKK